MKFLTIEGFEAGKNGPVGTSFSTFKAQVNPSSLSVKYGITYTEDLQNGAIIPQKKYTGAKSQVVSFELVLDSSGVIPNNNPLAKDVKEQIELFKKTCYYYIGSEHETPYVKIHINNESLFKYNKQAFFGRIESFDITYTMFSSEGEPIRAKINATFSGTMDPKTESSLKDNQSPDLTHIITVRAGDTLPMLCKRVYGDRQMYHEVAKANNLISFRYIEPGTELIFPPIK
ncbi:MAG TPA: hypothetical protein P5132_00250 [Bacteroidales bacterium]|nr:hypothetical protein [Bacteroidales bacterium]